VVAAFLYPGIRDRAWPRGGQSCGDWSPAAEGTFAAGYTGRARALHVLAVAVGAETLARRCGPLIVLEGGPAAIGAALGM